MNLVVGGTIQPIAAYDYLVSAGWLAGHWRTWGPYIHISVGWQEISQVPQFSTWLLTIQQASSGSNPW